MNSETTSTSGADTGGTAAAGPTAATAAPLMGVRSPLSGREWLWVAAIVAVAFGVRLIYTLQLRSSPHFEHEILDQLFYDEWARAIVHGRPYVEGPFFQAPLYAYFLAGLYGLTGGSYLGARLLQGLLGSINCALLYFVGRRFFGHTVATVAGLLAAAYWTLVFYDAEFLDPVLTTFFNLLLLWCLSRAAAGGGAGVWFAGGLALGLSAITRPTILLFAAAGVAWVFVLHRRQWSALLRHGAAFVVGVAAPILPVTIRNYRAGNDFVLISSNGGLNFYIGNNAESNGISAAAPGARVDLRGMYLDTSRRAELREGRKLRPSEVSRYYFSEAWDFIRERPGEAGALMFRKLRHFWGVAELPNTKSMEYVAQMYAPFLGRLPVGFGILAPLGLVGLVLSLRRARELFPLWGFVLVYMAGVVLFFVNSRYRVPVVWPLVLLASYAYFWILERYQQRQNRAFGTAVVGLVAAAAVVVAGAPRVTTDHADMVFAAGRSKLTQREFAEAAQDFRAALALRPAMVDARVGLAAALAGQGKIDEAIEESRQAVDQKPDSVAALKSLATLLLNRFEALGRERRMEEAGRCLVEAGQLLEKAVQAGAPQERPYGALAAVLAMMGRQEEAVRVYRSGAEVNPNDGELRYHYGMLLARRGAWTEAIEHMRAGLGLLPDRMELRGEAVTTLLSSGRYREAESLLRWLLERDPQDSSSLMALASLLSKCPDDAVRNGPEAVQLAERALEGMGRDNAHALATLAAAFAEAGRFDEAASTMEEALQVLEKRRPSDFESRSQHYHAQLEQFRAGKPYRLTPPPTTTAPAATRPAMAPP